MARAPETTLYAPVKTWLEALGYEVKSEVAGADVVACKPGAPPLIVELKAGFSLTLLQQAIARQAVTDDVYVAVPHCSGRAAWKAFRANLGLCRRLGLGVLTVDAASGAVAVHADPGPFQPRKSSRRAAKLLTEFKARAGDPNTGGAARMQIETAYRQDARRCAAYLSEHGPTKGAMVARATGVGRATRLMADNHYGWFDRVETGIYTVTDHGRAAAAEAPPPVRTEDG